MMTRARLADVLEEFSFNGELSRTQLEHAIGLADSLEQGASADELISEAVDAGVLDPLNGPGQESESPNQVTPNRPLTFEVVDR